LAIDLKGLKIDPTLTTKELTMETPATPVTPPTPPPSNTIQYDDFAKIELRVATVLECKAHPNADKLLVLQIDLGNEKRQICAGLRQHYAPEQLVGKTIVVVANLAPRTMRGEVSQGMLLAATDPASGKVIFVSPSEPAAPGSKVS
jgi:methionyl-tRNA synthetase